MKNIDVQLKKQESTFQIKVIGEIDENSNFAPFPLKGAKSVYFDLTDLKSINSLGVKAWIEWLSDAPDAHYIFANCPEIFVHQANIMAGFLPSNFEIKSFFIPYFSEDQDTDKYFLFEYEKDYSKENFSFPDKITDSTGVTFCVGVNFKRYLQFLKKSRTKV